MTDELAVFSLEDLASRLHWHFSGICSLNLESSEATEMERAYSHTCLLFFPKASSKVKQVRGRFETSSSSFSYAFLLDNILFDRE